MRDVNPRKRIPDPDLDFIPIPDHGSGSATLGYVSTTLLHGELDTPPQVSQVSKKVNRKDTSGPTHVRRTRNMSLRRFLRDSLTR